MRTITKLSILTPVLAAACGGEDPTPWTAAARGEMPSIQRTTSAPALEETRPPFEVALVGQPGASVVIPVVSAPSQLTAAVAPTFLQLLRDKNHHRFAKMLEETGLAQDLEAGVGPFTVLAPHPAALDVMIDTHPDLDEERLHYMRAFLEQHVLEGSFDPAEVADAQRMTLRPDLTLEPGVDRRLRSVSGDATAPTGQWWAARQGRVVEVDEALSPVFHVEDDLRELGFGLFLEALVASGYEELADWTTYATVFAPSDDAFRAAGWTQDSLHEPANRDAVQAMVAQHVAEGCSPADYFERDLLTETGHPLRVEHVYDETTGRDRSGVLRYGDLQAFVSDDYAEAFSDRGAIVALDRVIVPKF